MSVAQTSVHTWYFQVSQLASLWKQPNVTLKPDAQIQAKTKLKLSVYIPSHFAESRTYSKHGNRNRTCTTNMVSVFTSVLGSVHMRQMLIPSVNKTYRTSKIKNVFLFSYVLLRMCYAIFQVHGRCKKNNISGSKHYLTVASGVMTSVFVSPVLAAVTVGEIIFQNSFNTT